MLRVYDRYQLLDKGASFGNYDGEDSRMSHRASSDSTD